MFSDVETMEFYANVKKKILVEMQLMEDPDNHLLLTQLDQLNRFFATFNKPNIFDQADPDNSVRHLELKFETLCAVLESNNVLNAKEMTCFEFYSRLEYLKKAADKNKVN